MRLNRSKPTGTVCTVTESKLGQPAQMVRILLAEDHAVMRQRLKRLLVQQPGFQLVADTGDGLEAVRMAVLLTPDVVVTDLVMPGLHGLEVTRRVRQQAPRTCIVVVSIYADEPYVLEAFRHGALSFVRKDEAGRHLVPAIRAVLAGQHYLSPSLADLTVRLASGNSCRAERASDKSLKHRDRSALQLAAQGYADAEIAFLLKLSGAQATRLLARLMRKLGLRTHTELTSWARKNGLAGGYPRGV
jgi:two-component system, NarL family, response regulator NreC